MTTNDVSVLLEMGMEDAPSWLGSEEASAWSSGFNTALERLGNSLVVTEEMREAAAKAVYESRGLHLSTGRDFSSATGGDRHYSRQAADAAIDAVLSMLQAPSPSEDEPGEPAPGI